MAILFHDKNKTYSLHTKNTTYQMKVDKYGTLLHLYYGKRVEDVNMDYLLQYLDVGFSPNPYEAGLDRTYSLDTLPQEYPTFGGGDFRNTGLMVEHEDGSRAVRLCYISHEISNTVYDISGLPAALSADNQGQSLLITLRDKSSDLEVELLYGVFEDTDMITRAVRIKNCGSKRLWLEKVHSACLDIAYGEWDLVHFHGRHNMERLFERIPLAHGTISIGSRRGTSSHQHNPGALICGKDTTEDHGSCYGILLAYSGNFTIDVECDQMNQVRATMGISPEQFRYSLEAGAVFHAPQAIMTYSDSGFAPISHRYHHFIRHHICRGNFKLKRRPVLINNWEATYFDFDETKILQIASQAAQLGIELLVLDDGWFGKRDSDDSGLGDWYVNVNKLKGGLAPLATQINDLGMEFGLWVEPEMISEDSDLYRAHPDWALTIPNRQPTRGRMQLVLDMGRTEVVDYLYDQLSNILLSAPITYVKWDFNRSITDFYSHALPPERQGEGLHRFVLGLYELLERLITKFPNILFESCSGGGGRFDAGMLYYTPQIWCSDDTDAIERLEIQYGTSFFYPLSSIGSHVSASPNHQTKRTTPIHTRAVTAMAGSFGYELDLNLISESEKEQVRNQISNFIKYDSLIHNGLYYRLAGPYDNKNLTAWEIVSEDQREALVSIVATHVRANLLSGCLKVKGLHAEGNYRIEWLHDVSAGEIEHLNGGNCGSDTIYSGAALMYGGIPLPSLLGDYPAIQIYIREV